MWPHRHQPTRLSCPWVWGKAKEFAFLTRFQMMPMLLVWELFFSKSIFIWGIVDVLVFAVHQSESVIHIHMSTHLYRFYSHIGYYRVLSRVGSCFLGTDSLVVIKDMILLWTSWLYFFVRIGQRLLTLWNEILISCWALRILTKTNCRQTDWAFLINSSLPLTTTKILHMKINQSSLCFDIKERH